MNIFRDLFDYAVSMQEHITSYYDDATLHDSINQMEDALDMGDDDQADESTHAMNDYMRTIMMDAFADHESTRLRQGTNVQVEKATTLLTKRQVEQRSAEWYAETTALLTASEVGQIFKPPRTRGQLVMSKAFPVPRPSGGGGAVPSELMTAFDWGIRFEPVVKQVYEAQFSGTKIHDVGRIYHESMSKCAASPDGIVLGTHEKAGRLIEIKCPVSRELGKHIPADYYAQMQQQLEVCDLEECDYMEVKIRSKYSNEAPLLIEGPALYYGCLWRIEYSELSEDDEERHRSYYLYGPVGDMSATCPPLPEGHDIVEVIPWEVVKINLITVRRDRHWWAGAASKIAEFWKDVEKARTGAFVLPPSSRIMKTVAEEQCMIILPRSED
jgi:hypothetical protein